MTKKSKRKTEKRRKRAKLRAKQRAKKKHEKRERMNGYESEARRGVQRNLKAAYPALALAMLLTQRKANHD
jgi:hypothetical protein